LRNTPEEDVMKELFNKAIGRVDASDKGRAAAAGATGASSSTSGTTGTTGASNMTGSTGGTGAATGRQEHFGASLTVAETQYGPKKLTQVYTWTPCEKVRELPAQFYCLDMDEQPVDETVQWVRDVRQIKPFERRRLPVIYVIGPARPLSSRELRAVNEELASAGAYFFKRPNYNASFEATMQALRDELARQYGPSATNSAGGVQEQDSLLTR
jgi:hypothetical protein